MVLYQGKSPSRLKSYLVRSGSVLIMIACARGGAPASFVRDQQGTSDHRQAVSMAYADSVIRRHLGKNVVDMDTVCSSSTGLTRDARTFQ